MGYSGSISTAVMVLSNNINVKGNFKMKRNYEDAELNVVKFECEEIMLSGGGVEVDPNPGIPDTGEGWDD